MKIFNLILAGLLAAWFVGYAAASLPPKAIHLTDKNQYVCASYLAGGRTQWSCKTAGDISAWILEGE